ncbi:hypothetical protein [Flavobacterium sp. AG291]|uniref:hypothetical protein n=1 Tax=Flavobacterium sp. AG291 TaxID=2184000 RepID=UPI000E0C3416|nr:hypothetical protein [Flavobacterium sp. AG291]RDI13205.1 hypothetical protein DEU42_103115 [Flavobacterium sp. AG291]
MKVFKIPKPRNLDTEKELSDFKLKLAEYADKISYDDSGIQFIKIELELSDGIDEEEFDKFFNSYPYIGHF